MEVKEAMDGQPRRCAVCGRPIRPGNRAPGIPNGLTFVYRDGTRVPMCAECIMLVDKIKRDE